MRELGRKFRGAVVGDVTAIVVSIFFPFVAVILYLLVALFLFVPFRAVAAEIRAVRRS
jgi:hypothetical protein